MKCPWSSGVITVALAVLGLNASDSSAQQTVAPKQLFRNTLELDSPWLALLREANAQGSQEKLVSVITEFLADVSMTKEVLDALATAPASSPCCDQDADVFEVVFLATEAADAPLVRILVHKQGLSRGTLPGIEGAAKPLFEVFVAEALTIRLDSIYQSEALEDPLAKESGEFVRLVVSKLALPVGSHALVGRLSMAMNSLSSESQDEVKRSKPPLAVTLSRVELPGKRAKITINHTITVTDPAAHLRAQAALISDSTTRAALLNTALERVSSADPSCRSIAAQIRSAIDETTAKGECSPLATDPTKCFTTVKEAISTAYQAAAKNNELCKAADAYSIVRRFVSSVPEKFAMQVKGSTIVMNTPKTHWTLGLSTAFIAGIKTDNDHPRAKISNGKIVVDPFSRLLAMGIVAWVPAGYDPNAVEMQRKERVRLFGGVAFAPHFGGTGGAAWSFNRYIGASIGYAYLVYDTPKSTETLDSEPTAANKAAPFDLVGTHAWFVGLTYNIK